MYRIIRDLQRYFTCPASISFINITLKSTIMSLQFQVALKSFNLTITVNTMEVTAGCYHKDLKFIMWFTLESVIIVANVSGMAVWSVTLYSASVGSKVGYALTYVIVLIGVLFCIAYVFVLSFFDTKNLCFNISLQKNI